MAEIVCVIGTKGGSGKTTLAHMLCHGLHLLDRKGACVMTDEQRSPLCHEGRNYVLADARSPEARHKVIAKLRELSHWIGVLDGGANRTATDLALYEVADLVLLPFRDSAEDLRVVARDLERFPRAHALPSQWPTNRWQLDAADRLIAGLPEDFRHRIISPAYAISASKLLLQNTPPQILPSALNNAARALARQTLTLLSGGHSTYPARHPVADAPASP